VLVHDVVHPLAERALVERVIAAARETGAASAAMPLYGSVHAVRNEHGVTTMGTSHQGPLWLTQKPAVAPRAALLHGLELDAVAPRSDGAATVDMVARAGAAEAESADLIVVGSRALDPAGRFLLGSVSDYVVNNSTCPVLIAR